MKKSIDKTIAKHGEFGLIDRLRRFLPDTSDGKIIIGVGDDTAVIALSGQRCLLATCDTMIEGTHFTRETISFYQLGSKAMAVNLSDIAAMGGQPQYALISLGLPSSLPEQDFDDLYRGLTDMGQRYNTAIVGGNMSGSSDLIILNITLLGECERKYLITRSGAHPGDRIYVSGAVGSSAAGLALLKRFGADYSQKYDHLINSHLQPVPRVDLGTALGQSGIVTSMIDVSDGLAGDLGHVCTMSKVGAEIFSSDLPNSEVFSEAIAEFGFDQLDLSLHGGEDYELLFTVTPDAPCDLIPKIEAQYNIPLTCIGNILPTEQGRILVDESGARSKLIPMGWDHYTR